MLCFVKGNTLANAFPVDINKDQLVSHLKEVIKAKKHKTFHDVKADKLKLWKVSISNDRVNLISNLSLKNSKELLAIRKISKYFPDSSLEEHIHVLVEPPETTIASSHEQELLNHIAVLEESLSKSVYSTYFIVFRLKREISYQTTIHLLTQLLHYSVRRYH